MKTNRHLIVLGLFCLLMSARAEEGLSRESEIWNAGVDACLAGDLTNAVEILRPLEGSKTHGARVASIVAKAEFEAAKAQAETNLAARIGHLEAAAVAAQTALRANPLDERLKGNLALATAEIPALRDARHLQEVLASAGKKDPLAMVKQSLKDVRAVMSESGAEATAGLSPEDRIVRAEAMERRVKGLSDVCLVLKEKAKGQEGENAGQIVEVLDNIHDEARAAARQLGDLDAEAGTAVAKVEARTTEFYRAMLEPWAALSESLDSQSNACRNVAAIGSRSWQVDALGYTQVFNAKFPQWAERYEQSRQADTNAPPLTAETRQQIEALAEQLMQEQSVCCQNPESERQENALQLIRRIMELKPQPKQPPQPQQQQDQQDQQQQDQQKQDQQQNQQQDQQQDQHKQDQQEQQQQDQQQGQQQGKQDEKQERDDESQKSEAEQKEGESSGEEDKQDDAKQAEEEKSERKSEEEKAAAAEVSEQEKADKDLLMRVLERSAENKDKMKGRKKLPRTGSNRDW